ncbi:GAF domain-containing sensor histidine kinase [Amycolatopsis magusensis]|uniref:GAF domain-containing sensor histidine kinase n=1 Tax=Amycolatopsis magusensis TaxID=882444 RepID=UPI00378D96B5
MTEGEVLRLVVARARELLGADHTLLVLPDDGALAEVVEALVVIAAAGPAADGFDGRRLPISRTIGGAVFRSGKARRALSPGAGLDDRFGPALAVPLRAGDEVSGVLIALRDKGGEPFEANRVPVAEGVAEQAALAVRTAREQLHQYELDLLNERDRIARELHDHVIQRVFAVGLSLQSIRHRAESPELRRRLGECVEDLQEVVREIRGTIFDLHGDPEGATWLRRRLQQVIGELVEDSGMRSVVRMTGPLSVVPPDLAEHAEAVVREAVRNTVRHAGAKTVTVAVAVENELSIGVSDDGAGIAPELIHSGLAALAARAADAGGTLHVQASPEGGTRLLWSVPLP